MSEEKAAERPADNDAARLLDRALGLRMYGEGAPGNSDTWSAWDRDCEGFLRDRLCAEKGHAAEGNCCPAWVTANG